jgi:hypothetical protein
MRLRLTVKHFIVLVLTFVVGAIVFSAPKASADVVLTPNPGPLPGPVRNYFVNADSLPFSPAFRAWLSRGGQPSVTSWTVPYGSAAADLDFHWGGVVGYQPSSTTQSRLRIVSVGTAPGTPPGGIFGIGAGNGFTLTFAPNQNSPGAFRQAARGFQYRPTGGFTDSTPGGVDYNINVFYQAINQFADGSYGCIAVNRPTNGFDFNACPVSGVSLTVHITVPPAPVDSGSCSVSAPANVFPGQTFDATFTARNTGDINWGVNNGLPTRYYMRDPTAPGQWGPITQLEIEGPGVVGSGFGPLLLSHRSTTWTRGTFTAPTALGSYTFDWVIHHGGTGNLGSFCTQTINVVEEPYFRVYGGDVIAGAGFAGAGPCTNQDAPIISWNRPNGTGPYIGSGGQMAVMAMHAIYEFASGQTRTNSAQPKSSTFANVAPSFNNYAVNPYGGGLIASPGTAPCAPDWMAGVSGTNPGPTLAVPNVPDTVLTLHSPGDLTIPAINLAARSRVTVYVDGNAFIEGTGIRYLNSNNYANIFEIPSFRLIVRGNIYIAPTVTQLDGNYIAQPSTPTNGRIYTCGGQLWAARAGLLRYVPDDAGLRGVCRTNRLTVYGTMTADTIKLLRTRGTLTNSVPNESSSAGGNPGEVFIDTAETWLSGGLDNAEGEADGYVPLPPVL